MNNQKKWQLLLQLKSKIDDFSEEISFCYFSEKTILINERPAVFEEEAMVIDLKKSDAFSGQESVLFLDNFLKLSLRKGDSIPDDIFQFCKLYLPYCFLNYFAKKLNRCISVAHFAQTLDGKIATENGNSHWIGNEENLIHAHRMRALCDGIIVGSNTIKNDQPKLTVRKVEGENPIRIVVGSSEVNIDSMVKSCPKSILVVNNEVAYESKQVQQLKYVSDNCKIEGNLLLKLLYDRGIQSVYIEGGAMTTSNFLNDKAVDVLQLHIAPMVFGSGKQGIVLPEIETVKDGQQFKTFDFFKMGDSVMFVGRL